MGNGVVGYFVEGGDDNNSKVGNSVVGKTSPPSSSAIISGLGNGVVGVGKGVVSALEVSGLGPGVCSVGKGVVGDSTNAAEGIAEETVASVSVLVKSFPDEKKSVVG